MISDVVTGWDELDKAEPGYHRAQAYYDGDVDEVFASPEIRRQLARTGDDYKFNFSKTPVTTVLAKVKLTTVVADAKSSTDRLKEIWDANDMDVHYPDLFRRTFEYGDAYVFVWPVDDDQATVENSSQDDPLTAAGVELSVFSPLNVRLIYDPQNPRRKIFCIQRWSLVTEAGEKIWRVVLWYPDTIEHWISKPGVQDYTDPMCWMPYSVSPVALVDADDFTQDGSVEENPWGEIPWFHHRTGLPYGLPVHKDAYGPQNAITKALITGLTTMDSAGFPQRYALVDPTYALSENREQPDWDDDLAPHQGSRTGRQAQRDRSKIGGPGTLNEFHGMKEVGQWDAALPSTFLDPAQFYLRSMAQLTDTPLHYFDPSGDVPSGESLKVADQPLSDKASYLKKLQSSAIAEEWLLAARIVSVPATTIEARWEPSEAATTLDDWAVVSAKIEAGVPQRQALIDAGNDPDVVDGWLADDQEALDLTRRVGLLSTMATAVQALGQAVALGAIDAGGVQQLVAQVMGDIEPDVKLITKTSDQIKAEADQRAQEAVQRMQDSTQPPAEKGSDQGGGNKPPVPPGKPA